MYKYVCSDIWWPAIFFQHLLDMFHFLLLDWFGLPEASNFKSMKSIEVQIPGTTFGSRMAVATW